MPSIKPTLHPLKTPQTMTFPSELHADPNSTSHSLSSNPNPNARHDEPLSTPITPPAAYTEFLKAFTPIFSPDSLNSPGCSTPRDFTRFTFEKPFDTRSPTSQPGSAISTSFNFEPVRSATASLPPPTPYGAPFPRRDPRSLRSLRIPPPPPVPVPASVSAAAAAATATATATTPASATAPPAASATTAPTTAGAAAAPAPTPLLPPRYSPMESPRSATLLRSPYSPNDWKMRYYEGPRSANSRVSVRHVVTHTVTYKRTQLEDPPKGKKRRKCDEGEGEGEREGRRGESRRERERARARERDSESEESEEGDEEDED